VTYSPTFGPGAETEPLGHAEVHELQVEFIMDTHRVSGSLRYAGPPRRVVDLLNAIDAGYILVYDGVIDSAIRAGEGARSFEVAQVRRDGVLIAIPRTEAATGGGGFEAVKKVPFPVTLAVPGYGIAGNMHMVAEANRVTTPILASRHFTPVTDAVITRAFDGFAFPEPIVIVNLACTVLYAPHAGA